MGTWTTVSGPPGLQAAAQPFLQKHSLLLPKDQVCPAGAQGQSSRAASLKLHPQLPKSRLKENKPMTQVCIYRACSEKIHPKWMPGAPPGQGRDQQWQSKGSLTYDNLHVRIQIKLETPPQAVS